MNLDKKQLKTLEKAADRGDGAAAAELCRYYNIEAMRSAYNKWLKPLEKALMYGNKSAEADCPQGIVELARCVGMYMNDSYISGKVKSFEKIRDKMPARLKAAAEAGNADAMFYLGMSYFRVPYGCGLFARDNAAAVSWLEKAASAGHTLAAYFLGMRYARGLGMEQNDEKAAGYLSAAARKGHGLSAVYCDIMYPDVPPYLREGAVGNLRKTADRYLAKLLENIKAHGLPYAAIATAEKISKEANAGMSSPKLLYSVGLGEYFGVGGYVRDEEEGKKNIMYAAECCNTGAENTYACILLAENSGNTGTVKALQYIADAAEQNIWQNIDWIPYFETPENIMLWLVYDSDFLYAA